MRRDGATCAGQMSTVYQYNHQAGCLHLPQASQNTACPVALQVSPKAAHNSHGSQAIQTPCNPAISCHSAFLLLAGAQDANQRTLS